MALPPSNHPNLWHPFTQAKTAPPPLKVKAAQGVWLELATGQQLLDCISSWWVNTHGHSHPHIAQAIAHQAQTLEHVIFAGFTHDPAEQLAEKLVQKLPGDLSRVFFSDNGSTAVEVALKIAYQYWQNQGQPRSTFLAFEGAYHGDTFGAMAVGERCLFTAAFNDLMFGVEFAPLPQIWWGKDAIEAEEQGILAEITAKFQREPQKYAALILEPLVQGAGGMRMCRPEFLQQLVQVCRSAGVLVILDEVMTGFGRTGDWFACQRAAVEPDLICLSKGITGGFLPLAVTVATEHLYQAFYSDDPNHTLYHGHSYTANPLGCAAAIAGWDLMEHHEPRFMGLEQQHTRHLQALQEIPGVSRCRVMGTIAALDWVSDRSGYLSDWGLQVRQKAQERGLLLRPLGNVLYLLPPYCITDEELAWVYEQTRFILQDLSLS
ncbi:MAG: adenosylmethionine--8-amino-7-oxononanoate transaminase [Prochlorothrix sp.]|nr:adenosylmethionine--8-amino-7-oxononanoate transaminase [Prochlorothrix sp.]